MMCVLLCLCTRFSTGKSAPIVTIVGGYYEEKFPTSRLG